MKKVIALLIFLFLGDKVIAQSNSFLIKEFLTNKYYWVTLPEPYKLVIDTSYKKIRKSDNEAIKSNINYLVSDKKRDNLFKGENVRIRIVKNDYEDICDEDTSYCIPVDNFNIKDSSFDLHCKIYRIATKSKSDIKFRYYFLYKDLRFELSFWYWFDKSKISKPEQISELNKLIFSILKDVKLNAKTN